MKQFMVLVVAALICSVSFANFQSSSVAKDSSKLDGLRSAWKKEQTMHAASQDKNDITMVYGGADIARNGINTQSIAIA